MSDVMAGWRQVEPLAIFLGEQDGQISLLGNTIVGYSTEGAGQMMNLLTVWRQEATAQPVKIFIHLLRPDGTIASQFDGLGAAWEGWQTDDLLLQLHSLAVDLPPGVYRLTAGLYHPETAKRWTAAGRDSVELGQVILPLETTAADVP
jgi:hypothetical protein